MTNRLLKNLKKAQYVMLGLASYKINGLWDPEIVRSWIR